MYQYEVTLFDTTTGNRFTKYFENEYWWNKQRPRYEHSKKIKIVSVIRNW